MSIRSRVLALTAIAAAAGSGGIVSAGQAAAPAVTVFRNVTVIPMDSPQPRMLADQSVVVRGERIATIGASADIAIPAGARVIEGVAIYASWETDEDEWRLFEQFWVRR